MQLWKVNFSAENFSPTAYPDQAFAQLSL
ncbi:hypothetical protein D917_09555 [Trichinella nativa]|uniref:Uncharacterized protein n=1 Tax=Trichinella nativa TaxID=6335 RepID=A0A1Y3EKW8_9BILA|nr:hypothetical protein D917_09555 [Trichinella nativa]